MKSFNIVHNRLTEKAFKTLENEDMEKLGFSLYENEKIRVLLKQVHTDLEIENIQLYSNQIRNILLEHSKNIYNTYLIICIDEEIEYEKFFMIERNNIALRKYVIRDEKDLIRIPFLDNITDETENNPKNLNDIEFDIELKSVFSILEQYDSKNIKLKDYQIEEIVNNLMQGMGIENEY